MTLVSPACGQTAAVPDTITVEGALRRALATDPQLRQAEAQLEASRRSVRAAQMSFLPSLSVSAGSNQRFGLVFDQTAGQLVSRTSRFANVGLSGSITLFDGFNQWASLDQARAERQGQRLSSHRERQNVVYETLSAYLPVIQARQRLQIQQQALADQERMLDRVDELVEQGALPPGDRYQHQAAVASRKTAVLSTRRTLAQAKAALIRHIGLDPVGAYRFLAPEVPDSAEVGSLPSLEALLKEARSQRGDLRAAEARVQASREGVQMAQSARWPSLRLSGSAGTSFTSVKNSPFGDQLARNRSGFLGLSLSIPLFQSGQTVRQQAQAEATLTSAQQQARALGRQAGQEVRQAYTDTKLLAETLTASRQRLRAAQRALQATQQRYELGQASFAELQSAREQAIEARSALAQTRFELAFQRELLRYATGELGVGSGAVFSGGK